MGGGKNLTHNNIITVFPSYLRSNMVERFITHSSKFRNSKLLVAYENSFLLYGIL